MRTFLIHKYETTNVEDILVSKKGMVQKRMQYRILRETRKNAKMISGRDNQGAVKPFMEDNFQEMIKSAQIMESQYGHFWDKTTVNDLFLLY